MTYLSAVKLAGLSKRYGDVTAVDYLDLDVRKGEILGLLGPNGSGKSTTLKMILGLVKPDSGSVNVLGIDVEDDPVAVKRKVGYVPESPRVYEFLTGLEFLDFTGDVYGMQLEKKKKRIEEFLKALDLEGREGDMISSYSEGMKQKVVIISAIMHRPELLLLDEPTAGLFPNMVLEMKRIIRRLREAGKTILFIEHDMKVVMDISERIVVLNYGKKIGEGSPEEIQKDEDVINAYLGRRRKIAP